MRARSRIIAALASAAALVASFVAAPQAHAEIDVYSTPGEHTVNGRQWRTWCEPYSQTVRCRTEIWATVVLYGNGQYYRANWWTFNNLTYLSSPPQLWAGNPLATPGEHTINGRRWKTECNTPATGYGCRSYIWSDVVRAVPTSSGYRYERRPQWVFNSIVQFGALRTDLADLVIWRPPAGNPPPPPGSPSTPPTGTYSESRGPNWTNRVTLTYDDCPKSLSAFKTVILEAERMNVGLAVLPTGDCVTAGRIDPAFARAHGHYVFNHSVSHPNLTSLSRAGVLRQLSAPGIETTYGRPPYGAVNSAVRSAYAAKDMRVWLWNVDTNDWRGKSQSEVVNYVVSHAKAGDSVLMHMQWNGFSASAIRQMKDGLAARGIGVCRNNGAPTEVRPAAMNC